MKSYGGAVQERLDRLFNRGTVAGLSEGALLDRYVADGDEAAFAALVARHGPMVLGVCRRVLRDERDIEDAFQATFLVLVRRAGAIRDGDLVGRWLHGVAHRVAVRARAHAARRFVHEQSVDEPIEPCCSGSASADAERRELAAIVDEEVTRLPTTLRAPVMLCYLEGMSHDEAARRLRWPVGTVRSRMARARDILRHRLARRGVTAGGSAIATALARPPVPPEWLDATVRGSLNFATHPATAAATIASARSVALARRVLQTMVIAKLSYIGAAGLGIVLALGGARTLAFQGLGEAKPIGSASAVAQKSRDRGETPVPATPLEPDSDERINRILADVITVRLELERGTRHFADLQAELRKLEVELNSSRRKEPPAGPRQAAAIPPAREQKGGDHIPDRPRYISLNGRIAVIFHDGAKGAVYDPESGRSVPLKLPPIQEGRREIIFTANDAKELPHPALVQQATQPWYFAMDLDRHDKVTRIAAFSVLDGSWIEQAIPEPVDRSAVNYTGLGQVFILGRRIYAFSSRANRFGVLELPPDSSWTLSPHNPFDVEYNGRLYQFNYATGDWDDVYARAIEHAHKPAGVDRRVTRDQ